MGLETGTYIDDLNELWPLGSDYGSTADDHMRLIKKTVKNTFPNVTGEVTPTQTELNTLDGVNATLTAAELNILDGVTATNDEINQVAGVDGTAAVASKACILDSGKALPSGTVIPFEDQGVSFTTTYCEIRTLGAGVSEVLTEGWWMITAFSSEIELQLLRGVGDWTSGAPPAGVVASDGTSVRLKNVDSVSRNYRRFRIT